jgi:hypothetical protein
MHYLLDNVYLNLVVKGLQIEVSSTAHDVKGSFKIIRPVQEEKGASVDEA